MPEFQALPPAESCRRVSFEKVNVVPGIVTGSYVLIVEGKKPCLNMEVRLIPVIYVTQPEYWIIEVVGCVAEGICLTGIGEYNVAFDLGGNIGTEGIEVVGADSSKKIRISEFGHGN